MKRPALLLVSVLAACSGCATHHQCLPTEVGVTHGSVVPGVASFLAGERVDGVAVGRHIFVRPELADKRSLLEHELEHVRQYDSVGPSFFWRYFLETMRHGHAANRYELDADSAALANAKGAP